MSSTQAGIIAQYGFHYQRLAYIYYILKHTSSDRTYIYEGCDDIEVNSTEVYSDDSLIAIKSTTDGKLTSAIQVKSGYVDKECWARVIGNWLLLDRNPVMIEPRLIVEKALSYDIYDKTTVDYVVDYFIRHKNDKRNSIGRRVYEEFVTDDSDYSLIRGAVNNMISKTEVVSLTHDQMDSESEEVYISSYCPDIKLYQRAKKERYRRFKSAINEIIEDSLGRKESCILTYNDIISIVMDVSSQISDYHYSVDMSALHDKKRIQANELLNDSSLREVAELKKVDDRPAFIVRQLINELFYKDLREIYENGVNQAEYQAFSNHEETILDLDNPTPKEDFRHTTSKIIRSDLFSSSDIFSTGCYIYMTSDEAPEKRKITWGESTEE